MDIYFRLAIFYLRITSKIAKTEGVSKSWASESNAKTKQYNFQFQMRSINSTEKRGVLEHEILKVSRCDAGSASYLTNCSSNHSHTLKRSESTSTLRSTPNDLTIIEERYHTLEQDYQHLLQQTHRKQDHFSKQRSELEKYRVNHQKDRKQIERLQFLIAAAKKIALTPKNCNIESIRASRNLSKHKNTPAIKDRNTALQRDTVQLMDNWSPKGTDCGLRKTGKKQDFQAHYSKHKFVHSICQN